MPENGGAVRQIFCTVLERDIGLLDDVCPFWDQIRTTDLFPNTRLLCRRCPYGGRDPNA